MKQNMYPVLSHNLPEQIIYCIKWQYDSRILANHDTDPIPHFPSWFPICHRGR